jgi:hypothetical protein
MSRELLNKIIEWRNTKFSTLTDLDLLLDEAIEIEKQSPDPVMYIGELAFNELKKGWCGDVYCTNYEIGPNDVPLYAEPPASKPIEEINAELVEALNKICKACDPHTSHQEAFIVNTVNEALVKAQTLRGDLIITQFKAGDCIPEWVLKAPKKEFQCQATFAVDVEVHHSNLYIGPVRVYVLKEFYSNDILSMVRIQDAAKGEWTGAPTDWNSKPFNSIKEQE